jgi:hypothetical protein
VYEQETGGEKQYKRLIVCVEKREGSVYGTVRIRLKSVGNGNLQDA